MENGKNRWRATRPVAFVVAAMSSSACHGSKTLDGTPPSASTPTTTAPGSTAALGTASDRGRARRTATLKLQVNDPSAYCRSDDCSGTPPVSIRHLDSTEPLALTPGRCARSCADCREPVCPSRPCSSMGLPMMDTEFVWDGTYYEASTCGAGVPCVAERHASDGRYVGEWCGLRGSRTIDSIGAPQCIEGGGRRCVSIAFDFPAPSPQTTSF